MSASSPSFLTIATVSLRTFSESLRFLPPNLPAKAASSFTLSR